MIQFHCPCGQSLQVQDANAGRKVQCPSCRRVLDVPGGEVVQPIAVPRAAVSPPHANPHPSRPDQPPGPAVEGRPRPTTTSGMATASVILGVLSLVPCCSVVAGLPAIILGALGLVNINRGMGRVKGKGMAMTGLVTGVLSFPILLLILVLGPLWTAGAAARMQSTNNLKQIGLAMHDYNATNNTFPPAAICDINGKPLLSWRVAILPYIEQANLYNQFKLDEPWNGPNNSKLLGSMPKIYAVPQDTTTKPGYTHYQVFVGNGAAFDPPQPASGPGVTAGPHFTDFADGTSVTIMAVEAPGAPAVPWTKPEDLEYDPNLPLPTLGANGGGFLVVMADGSVHNVSSSTSEKTLRAAITRNGGEVLGSDW